MSVLPTKNSLSGAEVKDAVYSYKESEVTDQLYAFGSMLLGEIQDRSKLIDGKAVMVLGWSLAVLAFWFTQVKNFCGITSVLIGLASVTLALLGAVFAYKAMQTRNDWQWPSDKDWFCGVKDGTDDLKRFHVRSMHAARQSQLTITERKSRWLLWSERLLTSAAISLALGVFISVVAQVYRLL